MMLEVRFAMRRIVLLGGLGCNAPLPAERSGYARKRLGDLVMAA
jgi:hypothetical protein